MSPITLYLIPDMEASLPFLPLSISFIITSLSNVGQRFVVVVLLPLLKYCLC